MKWIILFLLLLTACSSMTRSDAIIITQDFVNERVKFITTEEGVSTEHPASITVLETIDRGGKWYVQLHIEADVNGELKQNDVLVVVDKKTKTVENMRKLNGTGEPNQPGQG